MKIPLAAKYGRSFQLIAFSVVIYSAAVAGHAQNTVGVSPPPPPASPSATPDLNATLLQYEGALRSAGEQHHKFIEYEIDLLRWVITITVPVVGAIFLSLGWRSRREIRAQVDARFKTSVDVVIEERLARFYQFLEENRKKIEETDRLIELVYDVAYAFHVLSVKLDDPEWEAARRDAEKSLQAWRRKMPSSRRLGILLGRLYKRLHDYDAAIRVLTEVLRERDNKQMPQDPDYAALLYNRACYQTLKAEELQKLDPSETRSLRSQAWKGLNISIALEPENKDEAKDDPDLQTLWNDWPKEGLGTVKLSDVRRGSGQFHTSLIRRMFSWFGKSA
jgi:hypothetical protein